MLHSDKILVDSVTAIDLDVPNANVHSTPPSSKSSVVELFSLRPWPAGPRGQAGFFYRSGSLGTPFYLALTLTIDGGESLRTNGMIAKTEASTASRRDRKAKSIAWA